ncbi:general transcription factor 3C polypeptide 3-like [Octopus vulgaris]|uniref:General transcription factor 3C polypeptide 3-like n=2 Tax=Octopus TaxID=6643 RepID=A0AA36F8Z3_OCTVU|nr:general transcription factor 3C polypeptide 3 [Octopus sinensis]CAI9728915.1 general transcription factor 3C polypeptide 3-like [Octopus vulgaris]
MENMAGDGTNSENQLFKILENEISAEQWMRWKQMKKQAGDLLVSSDEEEEEISGCLPTSSTSSKTAESSTVAKEPGKVDTKGYEGSIETMGVKLSGFNTDLTLKFLNGQITFNEFSTEMDNLHQVENTRETEVETDGEDLEAGVTEQEDDEDDEEVDDAGMIVDSKDEDWSPTPTPRKKKGKRIRKQRRKKTELPKHLQGLMGEANLKFARGEHQEAINMCLEVIRLAPQAIVPFQTLGMLYEEMGDLEKSLQLYLIAAHLWPNDPEEWARLAHMSKELNNPRQAIACYSKAIRCDASNADYIWARCNLYEQIDEHSKALEGYQSILQLMTAGGADAEDYWRLARDTSRAYLEAGDLSTALSTLQKACKNYPNLITSEDINTILEMQISQKIFVESLELLVKFCGVVFEFEKFNWSCESLYVPDGLVDGRLIPVKCTAPELLPIDLRAKLIVCMIHLKHHKIVEPLMQPFYEENIEQVGDLYLDIAEAYMENALYSEAKSLFSVLVHSTTYNEAAVWLKYGECLNCLGELESAVNSYQRVVELAPSHTGARISLSALQQQLGHSRDAVEALTIPGSSDSNPPKRDHILLVHKCHLLYSLNRFDEFYQCAKQLLFSHVRDEWKPVFRKVIFEFMSRRSRAESLEYFYQHIGKKEYFSETLVSADDLWDIFLMLCRGLWEKKMYNDLLDACIHGLTNPQILGDEEKYKEAEFLCLIACTLSRNGKLAYNLIREICVKEINNNQAWNLFNQVIICSSDGRHNRFCLRLMMKHPDNVALALLNAHNSMVSGTYKHSLGEYVNVYRQQPSDPLVNLCIGLAFIHMACQKFSSKKHALLIQGLSFVNAYTELRGECQETLYNVGRAMHQLGLTYAAVFYYKKAIHCSPPVGNKGGVFDLSREIAHNLSLIYQTSGSNDYARWIIQQYCVV